MQLLSFMGEILDVMPDRIHKHPTSANPSADALDLLRVLPVLRDALHARVLIFVILVRAAKGLLFSGVDILTLDVPALRHHGDLNCTFALISFACRRSARHPS
eukprot:CAMPEP_0204210944 /NCGR_PEP_ID=MMETSP0361-20130328/74286_1 /ASSEMBLY_ACC=CAM_ASM_000343 /TAXON_ID=268821 /ORGANISM="Scrippsiella Hangoei, Strain SHTV-5" /LENGTH=102 /DNA_ID=CAMNT_0051175149 /DNA_START=105 /DNA_END=411 /DNA_ORIENTATION=+